MSRMESPEEHAVGARIGYCGRLTAFLAEELNHQSMVCLEEPPDAHILEDIRRKLRIICNDLYDVTKPYKAPLDDEQAK